MSERLAIIIPSDLNGEIEKIQKVLHVDKSTVIHHLLSKSIKDPKIETVLEKYKKGKISFCKASERAGVNLWEFIKSFQEHKISLNISPEEAEQSIQRALNLDLSKYLRYPEDKIAKE